MDLDISAKMVVREAMSSPVISVPEDSSVVEVAKLMKDKKIGAIIITNAKGRPVGIVTERDVVTRIVAEGITPKEVRVKEVMSSPLRMVDPEMNLMEAMSLMDKLNIRRLGVSYKGELVGIVSDRDIIRLVPTIIEIIKERQWISSNDNLGPSTVGYCQRCEMYSTNLRPVDGEFLCEDCRAEEEALK